MKTSDYLVLALGLSIGANAAQVGIHFIHPVKHTQVVTCVGSQKIEGEKYVTYYMERPNKEIFSMTFDNPAAIPPSRPLRDIVYTDAGGDLRHFIKAQAQ